MIVTTLTKVSPNLVGRLSREMTGQRRRYKSQAALFLRTCFSRSHAVRGNEKSIATISFSKHVLKADAGLRSAGVAAPCPCQLPGHPWDPSERNASSLAGWLRTLPAGVREFPW